MRYSSNCSKEIYDKFIGEKMELGGDILCAQKLEQGTIPHASLLLIYIGTRFKDCDFPEEIEFFKNTLILQIDPASTLSPLALASQLARGSVDSILAKVVHGHRDDQRSCKPS